MGYQLTTTVATTTTSVLNGTTFPVTTTTSTHEDTRARLIDMPFLVRYYGTGKRPRSPRWFLEAGGAWRLATDIRTSLDSTDASGIVTCCTFMPTVPQHRSSVGAVAGAGMQFVDEFGIHVVPEVRYTRWLEQTFDNLTTRSQRNQVEARYFADVLVSATRFGSSRMQSRDQRERWSQCFASTGGVP